MGITWIETTEKKRWAKKTPKSGSASSTLTITENENQTIRGFGGCFNELGWAALQTLPAAKRKSILDTLFLPKQCDFSFCRLPIGASDYALDWYSLNENDGDYAMKRFSIDRDKKCLIPYIRQALSRRKNLTLFASPWSPPTWMKTKKAYNNGTLIWTKKNLDAYALYFEKFVKAYTRAGVRINQIHVQNEPNSNQKFPSCLWTGEKMRDFIRDYLGPRFAKNKIPCEIWAGTLEKGIEHGWETDLIGTVDYAQWAHTILSDAKARKYIAGVGYQWDGKGAMQQTHAAWPQMPIIQTENECGNGANSWTYAHYVFNLMWHSFNNGVVAYTYWNMVLPEGGESTWGWKQNSLVCVTPKGKVVYNPEFYVMRHFSQFVKPGAVRLSLTGMMAAYALAFRNPDGSVIAVIANPLERRESISLACGKAKRKLDLAPRSFNTIAVS